jgi:hypothetical protein
MGFKKSKIYVFLFFFIVVSALSLKEACPEENKWKFMGRIKDNNFSMHYDPSSVSYANGNDNYAEFKVKEELSEEGLERFKEKFYRYVKEVEKSSGTKFEDPEYWLKLFAGHETKEYTSQIDCLNNEFKILPNKAATFNFVIVNPIEPGSAEDKIKNEVCKTDKTNRTRD